MSWLAILLSLASLGGSGLPVNARTGKQCRAAKHAVLAKACKPKPKQQIKPKPTPAHDAPATPRPAPRSEPGPTPTPTATPGPVTNATPTPTPTATPVRYPSRTGVDLDEWTIRSSYRTLAAGPIDFNTVNVGEDDHNLSVRAGGREYGSLDFAPGESATLTLTLSAGTYTLYCSLLGHEEAGMSTAVTVG